MEAVLSATGVPTVTFWGAAQSVTGSMHLVEFGGRKYLLDCGLVHGARHEPRPRRHTFPFDPHDIAAVFLSHAHIDHCGNLPSLVQQGFDGPIYCTPATRDLIALMLRDSARIHEENSPVRRTVHPGDGASATPMHIGQDVGQVLGQCVPVPYGQPERIAPDVELHFADAAHILGSALVSLAFAGPRRDYRLTFTGDLGRRGMPLLRDPDPIPAGDLLICESTYGGKTHDPFAASAERLVEIVGRTIGRGGKVLIPCFSLGRMQAVVHSLRQFVHAGRLPDVPIYVDSPLAADIADVYRHHTDCLNEATQRELREFPDFLSGPPVHHVRSHEESRELSTSREPCIITAASGMCEGGRIVQHLKHSVDDPRTSIVMVSYQAPQTLGRRLMEPRPDVRIHGRRCPLWAEVVELDGFSGHADHNEMLEFLVPLAGQFHRVRLVHGEPEQAGILAKDLRAHGFPDVAIPSPGETVSLA